MILEGCNQLSFDTFLRSVFQRTCRKEKKHQGHLDQTSLDFAGIRIENR